MTDGEHDQRDSGAAPRPDEHDEVPAESPSSRRQWGPDVGAGAPQDDPVATTWVPAAPEEAASPWSPVVAASAGGGEPSPPWSPAPPTAAPAGGWTDPGTSGWDRSGAWAAAPTTVWQPQQQPQQQSPAPADARPSDPAAAGGWPAGWYGDPWSPGQERFWDGRSWTEHVGGAASDPFGTLATAPPAGIPPWPTPGRPRRSRFPWVAILAVALVVLVVVAVVVAVTGSDTKTSKAAIPPATLAPSRPGTSTAPTAPTTPTTIPAPQSADPDASLLPHLAVGSSDVPSTEIAGLIQQGNLLSQPTLDLCNGTYSSEQLRTARFQTEVADAQGNALFSSEAVLYSNANGTAEGFTELRTVAARCPSTPVPSPVGEPTVTTTFSAAPDRAWPQTPTVERLAFDFVTTDQQGNASNSTAVYLRRGRVFIGLYFPVPTTPPTIGNQSTIPGIVGLFASRMAALPSSVVTANVAPPNAT